MNEYTTHYTPLTKKETAVLHNFSIYNNRTYLHITYKNKERYISYSLNDFNKSIDITKYSSIELDNMYIYFTINHTPFKNRYMSHSVTDVVSILI